MASQNTSQRTRGTLDDGGFDFLGKELDDNARIWNVYRDEVTADDKAHGFEGWLQTLDVLLIFAGLFSAVVTAFLIDSYKLLQKPDQNDFIAAALYALVVATDNPALLRNLPKPSPLSSNPSFGERWTNALWFTSLIIALAVALLAILAKQWLQEFHRRLADRPSSSERLTSSEWTRKRWFYLKGITKWPTDSFITYVLPLMLHVALFLFLVGLVIFLWTLDIVIASLILCLTGLILGFYVACTLLPLWFPDAPTSTPLLSQTLVIVRPLRIVVLTAFDRAGDIWDSLKRQVFGPRVPLYSLPWVREQRRQERAFSRRIDPRDPAVIREEGKDDRAERVTDMLKWLIATCTNENAVMIGFQAISSLEFDSPLIPRLQEATVGMSALAHFGSNTTPSTLDAIRAIRSELVLGRGTWRSNRLILNVPDTVLNALKNLPNSDAILFDGAVRGCLLDNIHNVIHHLDSRGSTTRSALLLLRSKGSMDMSVLLCLLAVLDFASLDHRDYDLLRVLFGSCSCWCFCYPFQLNCILRIIAIMGDTRNELQAVWHSSLPAYVASRILLYCGDPRNNQPAHHFDESGPRILDYDSQLFLEFLDHPGWLHPMVWANITAHDSRPKTKLVTSIFRATDTRRAKLAITSLLDMVQMFPQSKLSTRGEIVPLATYTPFKSHEFYRMLSNLFINSNQFFQSGVPSRVLPILVKTLRFLLSVSHGKDRAGQSYPCTDALLGIAIGLSWFKRQGQGTRIVNAVGQLMSLIYRCCRREMDWSDPMATHLAQHIRELVPWYELDIVESWKSGDIGSVEEGLALRSTIANATPCMHPLCPGTPPANWTESESSSQSTPALALSASEDSLSHRVFADPAEDPTSYSSRLRAVAVLFADDEEASLASEELPDAPALVESLPAGDVDEDHEYMAAEQEAALWV